MVRLRLEIQLSGRMLAWHIHSPATHAHPQFKKKKAF